MSKGSTVPPKFLGSQEDWFSPDGTAPSPGALRRCSDGEIGEKWNHIDVMSDILLFFYLDWMTLTADVKSLNGFYHSKPLFLVLASQVVISMTRTRSSSTHLFQKSWLSSGLWRSCKAWLYREPHSCLLLSSDTALSPLVRIHCGHHATDMEAVMWFAQTLPSFVVFDFCFLLLRRVTNDWISFQKIFLLALDEWVVKNTLVLDTVYQRQYVLRTSLLLSYCMSVVSA